MPTRSISEVLRGQKLVTAPPGVTVREAAQLMAAEKKGALPVVGSGRLLGIFTERDAVFRVIARGLNPDTTTLADVMTKDPVTVLAERPLNHALHLMYEGGFRHIPALQAGRLVGVVSSRDALGPEIMEFEAELRQRDDLTKRM